MSKVKITTKEELSKFLKILAEEAVVSANGAVDAKSRQDRITNDIARGKSKFMKEEVPAAPGTESPPAETKPAPEQQQDKSKEKSSDSDDTHNVLEPKLGELIDAINLLRGVPSTRDSAVEEKLRGYFDGLSSAEASSLIIMVRSIASVMSGKVDPSQAKEPKDYNIRTEIDGNEKPAAPQALDAQKTQTPAQPPAAPRSNASPEKVEPPIKVDASTQVSESYRQRIRTLLKNN